MKTARTFTVVFLSAFMLQSVCIAQHLRIFACAIANDSAGAFLGGSSNGSGLYQSDDTGKTWKHLGWDNIKCYSMDMVESSNGRILYEATGLGVLRSIDGGEHWKQLTDWRVSEVMDVAVNQKNPNEIYIATAHGPWRTRDGGKTWNAIRRGMLSPYCSRIIIDYHNDSILLLASEDGLYRSENKGSVWKQIPGPVATREIVQEDSLFSIIGEDQYWWSLTRGEDTALNMPTYFPAWCISRSIPVAFGGTGQRLPVGFGGADGLLEWRIWTGEDTVIEYAWPGGPTESLDSGYVAPINVLVVPNNIASCIDAGPYRLAGSLGGGVLEAKRNSPEVTFQNWNEEKWVPSLQDRQIWTLKSFLVTP